MGLYHKLPFYFKQITKVQKDFKGMEKRKEKRATNEKAVINYILE